MRFFFFLSTFFYSCANDPELVNEFVLPENHPIEQIKQAEILHTENGVLKVKIIAGAIQRFDNDNPLIFFSGGVEVTFYNDQGIMQSTLIAVKAEVDEENNKMIAKNNIILTSSKGKTLETEELIWDEVTDKIYTDKEVIITTKKELIQGTGFESNSDFSKYTISNIKGVFSFENLD